jgi:hypothetical protein
VPRSGIVRFSRELILPKSAKSLAAQAEIELMAVLNGWEEGNISPNISEEFLPLAMDEALQG